MKLKLSVFTLDNVETDRHTKAEVLPAKQKLRILKGHKCK